MDPSPLSRRANRTLASKSSSISSPSEPNQLPLQLPLLPTELLTHSAQSPTGPTDPTGPTGPTPSAQSGHSSDVVTIGDIGSSEMSSGVRGESEKDEILELIDVGDLADVANVDREDEVPMTVDDAWALDDFSPNLEWIQPGPTPTTSTPSLDSDRVSVAEQSELMDGSKRTV